ncbi:hypothetical protein H9L39_10424 [Fusarium oxysporum f. sp. albedinis]|nr:hypothetical protein H9L39_10424 [Fusarium oxysporum f. sp. albedinis]
MAVGEPAPNKNRSIVGGGINDARIVKTRQERYVIIVVQGMRCAVPARGMREWMVETGVARRGKRETNTSVYDRPQEFQTQRKRERERGDGGGGGGVGVGLGWDGMGWDEE